MFHPSGRDDGESDTMRDVIVGREGVLDGVHGPSAAARSHR